MQEQFNKLHVHDKAVWWEAFFEEQDNEVDDCG